MSYEYGFIEKLNESNEKEEQVIEMLKKKLGTDVVKKNDDVELDKLGVDYIATDTLFDEDIFIDAKVRNRDCPDDVALEIWSNIEQKKIGWTLDDNKITDYILWVWNDKYLLVAFKPLRLAFKEHKEEWVTNYQTAKQRTGTLYHSSCVFVPIDVVKESMN